MKSKYLLVDVGNTRIKLGLYQDTNHKSIRYFSADQLHEVEKYTSQETFDAVMFSTVAGEHITRAIKNMLPGALDVKEAVSPIKSAYLSPFTLGSDRLANAVAIGQLGEGNRLAIDMGTCIKFDFVDKEGVYQGGSISPGIHLRYKAMNDYTGALPLIDERSPVDIVAKSTKECLHSGVINGIKGEIDFFIRQYESKYPDLTIFMTGGDAIHFDYSLKSNIFANENLTLDGLFLILKANEK